MGRDSVEQTTAKERLVTVTVGVLALLEAKPEKGAELEAVLVQVRQLALAEQQTISRYAFQADEVTSGIFDTFESDGGCWAHLGGEIAKTLMKVAPGLLTRAPDVRAGRPAPPSK